MSTFVINKSDPSYLVILDKKKIVSILVLNSMKKLHDYIASALVQQETAKARYDSICRGLVQYQEEFPFYLQNGVGQNQR